jgi:serine phosphatase RsbU (regulator of sigma subunit)
MRGSQRQIGYGFVNTDKSYSFEPHYFKFMPKDFIVMLSDGLIDQCDKNRRRFGSQRFSEFLVLNSDLPMRKLGTLLGNELQDFMGSAGQRDDITVLGFRMKD